MMERMKPVRERGITPEFLKGFSASVVRRIEAKDEPSPRPFGWKAAVPVFAVLVLAFVTLVRPGGILRPEAPAPEAAVFEIAQLPEPVQKAEATLADEIEALKELGAWTSEDEEAVGVEGEDAELEEVLG
jgi:hypothetical protein